MIPVALGLIVAIWSSNTGIRAIHIAPSGALVDRAPVSIAGVSDLGFDTSLRAISTGNELLVAWSTWNDYRYILGISPRPSPRTAIDGDVPRLFSRDLDRLGVVPRTRSIR